jgi:deoxyribose-phosphate aldolase
MSSVMPQMIEHTLLKADATHDAVKALCAEAVQHGFYGVCVNACNVRVCAEALKNTPVRIVAVVGFPLGAGTSLSKAYEAREAVSQGAHEIDMVMNIGALKNKDYKEVYEDIKAVVQAVAPKPVKVILETALLDHTQKTVACVLSQAAGALFVKTSTGFASSGALVEDVALMRATVASHVGVKASGGVRTAQQAQALVEAGAQRIGASASLVLIGVASDGVGTTY